MILAFFHVAKDEHHEGRFVINDFGHVLLLPDCLVPMSKVVKQ